MPVIVSIILCKWFCIFTSSLISSLLLSDILMQVYGVLSYLKYIAIYIYFIITKDSTLKNISKPVYKDILMQAILLCKKRILSHLQKQSLMTPNCSNFKIKYISRS